MSKQGGLRAPKSVNRGKKYPEHVKLTSISGKSQACYDFMEFLFTKGYHLGKYRGNIERLFPENPVLKDLLAEFFDIDLNTLEEEKLAMLQECRRQQDKGAQ